MMAVDSRKRCYFQSDLLTFCNIILDHESYNHHVPTRDSGSPLGSTGSEASSARVECAKRMRMDSDTEMDDASPFDEDDKNKMLNLETDESWDDISCFCGKPFSGRPMIECSICLTWVHLRCVRLRRDRIPRVFVCPSCKTDTSNNNNNNNNTEESKRGKSAPRRRKMRKNSVTKMEQEEEKKVCSRRTKLWKSSSASTIKTGV